MTVSDVSDEVADPDASGSPEAVEADLEPDEADLEDLPAAGRLPEAGTVHLWLFDVTAPWMDHLADTAVVSEVERTRARRMGTEKLSRRLLARRTAMRHVLGRYLDRRPEAVEVVAAPGGKPVLLPRAGEAKPTLAFSVGHSGDLYGIAVCTAARVGFDVEVARQVTRAEAIARRWFGSEEAATLDGMEGDTLERAFMRLWTGKEALAKRHGAGLRLMMRGDVAELDTVAAGEEGRLRWIEPRPDAVVAVASSRPVDRVLLVTPGSDGWIR